MAMNPLVALMLLKAGTGALQGGMQRGQMNDIGGGYQMYTEYGPGKRLSNALMGALGGGVDAAGQSLPAMWQQQQQQQQADTAFGRQKELEGIRFGNQKSLRELDNARQLSALQAKLNAEIEKKKSGDLLEQTKVLERMRKSDARMGGDETTDWGATPFGKFGRLGLGGIEMGESPNDVMMKHAAREASKPAALKAPAKPEKKPRPSPDRVAALRAKITAGNEKEAALALAELEELYREYDYTDPRSGWIPGLDIDVGPSADGLSVPGAAAGTPFEFLLK